MKNDRFARAGSVALGLGLLLILGRALETAYGIPGLPRSWYQNDWLWWLLGMACVGVGSSLLIQSESQDHVDEGWKPRVPGRRFQELVLYTRDGCHLCEEAAEIVHDYRRWLPSVTMTNIDSDAELVKQFGNCVPVIAVDGKIRFRGKVNVMLLRRLIEGTPPRSP